MSSDVNPEWKLVAIGRGSFATVSILQGRPVAFKHVLYSQRTPELQAEFEALCAIYDFCNADSFFLIPRPLAYYDPSISTSFTSPEATPPRRAARVRRPLVTEGDFAALKLGNAAYAMDQVLPLPLKTAEVIRSLFYPPTAREAPAPTLCRLYFGKVIESTKGPIAFFNSANFPLDLARYNQVLAAVPDAGLRTPEEISHGMGEILGCLHWNVGYDGRDIEFVLGGASFSGVESYIIDFNQVSPKRFVCRLRSTLITFQDACLEQESRRDSATCRLFFHKRSLLSSTSCQQ